MAATRLLHTSIEPLPVLLLPYAGFLEFNVQIHMPYILRQQFRHFQQNYSPSLKINNNQALCMQKSYTKFMAGSSISIVQLLSTVSRDILHFS